MSNQNEILSQFVSLTGASVDDATFYLNACDYNLNNAIDMFMSGDSPSTEQPQQSVSNVSRPYVNTGTRNTGGIRTFGDIARDNSKDDKKQEYYAGGGKSGIAVEGPEKVENDDYIENIFKSAQDHGAVNAYDYREEEKKFEGGGYTLGTNTRQSQYVTPEPQTGPVKVKLVFYKDSFTMDDGENREYQDPQNRDFLDDINRGVIPYELQTKYPGREVHVELIDKKGEDYKAPPKPSHIAFSGSGHSLGSTSNVPAVRTENIEYKEIQIDDSLPKASLRVRLATGGNITIRCNTTHTVGDIYSHIKALNPDVTNFELKTSYPVTTLSDLSQTVEEAGLKGSSLTQRIV